LGHLLFRKIFSGKNDFKKLSRTLDNRMSGTYTITFGDQAENHVGMQKLGTLAEEGFSLEDLKQAEAWFRNQNVPGIIYDLRLLLPQELQSGAEQAYLLHIPNAFRDADLLFAEQAALSYDKKARMRGRVVNKHVRHNVCFATHAQVADYEAGQGTVVAFNDVPLLNSLRGLLPEIIGDKARDLYAEGNHYYDPKACGIRFHGDSERRKVIALRLGESLPFHYQWYHWSNPVGTRGSIMLNHGDFYIMSEKAVGTDWKKRSQLTLRHAAGTNEFIEK